MLVDKYLDRADELDVDALCDKDGNVTICGIMQHIEQARTVSGRECMLALPATMRLLAFLPELCKMCVEVATVCVGSGWTSAKTTPNVSKTCCAKLAAQ